MSVNRSPAKSTGARRRLSGSVFVSYCEALSDFCFFFMVVISDVCFVFNPRLDYFGILCCLFLSHNLIDVPDDCFIDLNDVIWKSYGSFWVSLKIHLSNRLCFLTQQTQYVQHMKSIKMLKFVHAIKALSMSVYNCKNVFCKARATIFV